MRGAAATLLLATHCAAAAAAAYVPEPAVHYTPPPWRNTLKDGGGGGDMAAALLHPVTNIWHVMPLSRVSWAHISSTDLVSWSYHGNGSEPPAQGGGPRFESGGMIYDHQRNVTVAFADSPTAASVSRSPELAFGSFEAPTVLYSTTDPLNNGKNKTQSMGCWDPIMWWCAAPLAPPPPTHTHTQPDQVSMAGTSAPACTTLRTPAATATPATLPPSTARTSIAPAAKASSSTIPRPRSPGPGAS